MKLNFLNALNGKANHEEIAEQIIALEIKQKECEKERNLAKILCKEMRGKTLCGENVSLDIIKNADKGYEEASLNLEIVNEGLEELKNKLSEALQAYCDAESRNLSDARKKLEAERDKVMREFAKAKGRLLGLALTIYGDGERARINLERTGCFSDNSNPFLPELEFEKKRVLSEAKKPTFANLEEDFDRKTNWIRSFNLEQEYNQILAKYRKQYASVLEQAAS